MMEAATLDRPNFFAKLLLAWYAHHRRRLPWRKRIGSYKVLVTEKLLQQTSYGHVLKVFGDFFDKYNTVTDLAESDEKEIEHAICRLGFQRQRAIQLKSLARKILSDFGGKVPRDRTSLLTLHGVGNYVADAVLCYAYGKEIVPVDVNVRRIAYRLFKWGEEPRDQDIQRRMEDLVPKRNSRRFNWALQDFAGKVCSRAPKCSCCPISNVCYYHRVTMGLPNLN